MPMYAVKEARYYDTHSPLNNKWETTHRVGEQCDIYFLCDVGVTVLVGVWTLFWL